MNHHLINGGRIERAGELYRLIVPPTAHTQYVDAQFDDYAKQLPMRFANRPPQRLRVRARFSHPIGGLKGTAGFGFWNHPFGQAGQMLAAPSNVWFFHGSPESDLRVVRGVAGHGFKAATLNAPPLPPGGGRGARLINGWLDRLLQVPAISRLLMATAQRVVQAHERLLKLDITQWHTYEIDWQRQQAIFRIDGEEVLRAAKPPGGPLGFVAWIDNYKAIAADGRYEFGYIALAQTQWLELTIER